MKVGQSDSVNGVRSMKIIAVFEFPCEAVISKSATALENAKTGVTYR